MFTSRFNFLYSYFVYVHFFLFYAFIYLFSFYFIFLLNVVFLISIICTRVPTYIPGTTLFAKHQIYFSSLEFWARGKYGHEGGEEAVGSRKPKYHPSFENPHIKIDLLPRGQNPLSYYTI